MANSASPAAVDTETGVHETTAVLDNGAFGSRNIRFESGRLARQAAGAVVAYLDDETMLLSATTASKRPKDNFDFFPLTVDVEERMYAAGRIPGSFFRREGRPSTDAILTCRLIDRPLRPTFVSNLRNEVQVVITVQSLHPNDPYDVLAINAASASTQISGPALRRPGGRHPHGADRGPVGRLPDVGAARGRRVRHGDRGLDHLRRVRRRDLHGRGRGHRPGAHARRRAARRRRPRTSWPRAWRRRSPSCAPCARPRRTSTPRSASTTKDYPTFPPYQDDVLSAVTSAAGDDLDRTLTIAGKHERDDAQDALKERLVTELGPKFEGREKEIGEAFRSLTKSTVRQRILSDGFRIDGRGVTDIRPLAAEVEVIPRAHGSALFERGETQILGVTTLNMLRLEQNIDSLGPETTKRYMHHYNFPPFSTGETGRVGSPKRREIGHGALAERALVPVLPTREEFPYAIRQVSEALSSNGSTSMGSVCASTMSLLNAGVPLKAPVAGIAMGLVSGEVDGKETFVALTDILGAEDAFGDMDFKVAGTKDFVTALQLDTKLEGIPSEVLGKALTQAKGARLAILDVMAEAIDAPGRDERVRAAHHHGEGADRQDRRGHRAEGQDDQLDHRADRRRHLDRGRRHDLRRCGGRAQRPGRGRHDQRHRQPADAEDRRALPGHRGQDRGVRRVRLAGAGPRRPGAHLEARQRQADRQGRGRRERRRQAPRRDHRHRQPRQDQPRPRQGGRRRRRRRRTATPPPRAPAPRARVRPRPRRPPRAPSPAPSAEAPPDLDDGPRRRRRGCPGADRGDQHPAPGVARTVLPGGLRVVTEHVAGARSASVGLWVDVGSRDEPGFDPASRGAAHFLEHLLFKGTGRRSARQIAEEIDAVGGDLNAFTSKEHTCFYAHVLDTDMPLAVDVVCDVVLGGVMAAEDVELERDVVLSEIAGRDDDPEDLLADDFDDLLLGDHPLGGPVVGSEESVARDDPRRPRPVPRRALRPVPLGARGRRERHPRRRPRGRHGGVRRPARRRREPAGRGPTRRPRPPLPADRLAVREDDTEQAHLMLGVPSVRRNDPRWEAQLVLSTVLGGGTSSRLFQEVRERRGLAYSVYSSATGYSDLGVLSVYVGCAPERLGTAAGVLRTQLADLARGGVTDAELARARGQLRGEYVLGSRGHLVAHELAGPPRARRPPTARWTSRTRSPASTR